MAESTLTLRLSIMTNLEQQLNDQGVELSPHRLEFFNEAINSYNRLRITSFITDSEAKKVGQRITNGIAKEVKLKGQ